MDGHGMMNNYGYFSPMGFFWVLFMLIIPIGMVVLVILGIVSLIASLTRSNSSVASASRSCSNCGKPAQADWNSCHFCSTSLK